MVVTLRQLRALVALADTGSFTRAAESLSVTQSALSGLIKELESQLDVRLVDRTTRRNQLTDIGKDFYAMTSSILRELDRALDDIDDFKHLRRGVVRVAAPQLMASTLMPATMASFTRKYPGVEIYMVDCAVEDVIDNVIMNKVDFGIGPQRSVEGPIKATSFMAPPFMAVLPRDHPLQESESIRWRDLVRYPLITLKGQFADQLERDLFETGDVGPIKPRHEVTFMSTALSLVDAGLGVSVCLPYAQPLIDLYRLEVRPLIEPEVFRRFFIYTKRYANLAPAAQAFIDELRAGNSQLDISDADEL